MRTPEGVLTTPQKAKALLDLAAGSALGIIVRTNDVARAKMALYAARAREPLPQYATLQIRLSPFPPDDDMPSGMGDLVVCKGGVAPARKLTAPFPIDPES